MLVTYDEEKCQKNMVKHGIDLAECISVFDSPMLTIDDNRETYGEQRLKSFGWLYGRVVVIVWTDRKSGPHLISCRYGDKHETKRYFKTIFHC